MHLANPQIPASKAAATREIWKAGRGSLQFKSVRGRTVLTEARATNPLAIVSPRTRTDFAWAVCATLGGGLLAGDEIRINVSVAPNCRAVIGTQASTKIFRSENGAISCQSLTASVGANAMLILAYDPVTCFAGAFYEQRQSIELAGSASLVVIDWFTSGRWSRGERWAMKSYRSALDIFVNGKQMLRDHLRLDAADGDLASPSRMGRFNCFATVVIIGEQLSVAAQKLLEVVAQQPISVSAEIVFSASAIPGGAISRIAGPSVEAVADWLGEHLGFVAALIGRDPLRRKQ